MKEVYLKVQSHIYIQLFIYLFIYISFGTNIFLVIFHLKSCVEIVSYIL